MAEEQNNDTKTDGVTRRDFLKNSGLVVGGVVGGGLLGGLITNTFMDDGQSVSPTADNGDDPQDAEQLTKARMFFKRAEDFRVLSAAVERIFPEDDIGPGAISLAIPYFIDKQLAGEYGFNSREYMEGPFFEARLLKAHKQACEEEKCSCTVYPNCKKWHRVSMTNPFLI